MPQFDLSFYPAQIFWLFVSFGFLYLMMRCLICPKIEAVLTARENRVQDILVQAEELNKQAADYQQRHHDFLENTEREKTDKIQKAYRVIQRKRKSRETKNENRLRGRIRREEQKIETMTEALKSKSKDVSKKLANQLADKIERKLP